MHRYLYRAFIVLMISTLLFPASIPSSAEQRYAASAAQPTPTPPLPAGLTVSRPLNYSLSPALRDLARIAPPPRKFEPPREIPLMRLPKATKGGSRGKLGALLQNWVGSAKMPSTLVNFEGNSNQDNQTVAGGMIQPPDTQGEVGPNHYVQWVNLVYSIYDKAGNRLLGPLAGNTLWASNPAFAACDTSNDGDVITLYDPLADRWLMSQFALPNYPNGPFYQCIAVSQTGDPTGAWYLYEYQMPVNKMNDYPKFGVWPDAYYMTVNQFAAGTGNWAGAGVAAFERSRMLTGNPAARMVYIDIGAVTTDYGGMLPADLDGPPLGNSVPAGTPGLFVEWDDSTWLGDPTDTLRVWEFNVDWANPANSTFGINANYDPNYQIPTLDVDPEMCGYNRNCIPQPGTTQRLDAISDRLMYRLQYRNFGSYQTLASNHTVDADGTDHAGIHWFILRNDGSGWTMDQEGVYAPDSHHRWMGSFALDHVGNAALGYSISSSTVYPGIRYDGRLVTDPPGTLPQGEAVLINGTGSQTGWSNRWGDYSMMSVDPSDDCTFWYTQEYYAVNGSVWQTRIGSFKFPNCSAGAAGTLIGQVYDDTTLNGIGGASVQAASSPTQTFGTTTNSSGYYTLTLPVGTYTVTASAYGYQPNSISGVDILSGTVTVQDIPLSPAPAYVVSGTVTDANTGWPLYAHINIVGYPGGGIWNNPVTGFYSITLPGSVTYTFQVEAWVNGYLGEEREVFVTSDQTEDFALQVNSATCTAPGYFRTGGLVETFNSTTIPPGWTVVDNAGTGAVWEFDNPCSRTNLTGGSGNFAIADSDCAGSVDMDTELRTPLLDFTGWAAVTLEFKYDWNEYSGTEVGDVDVSNDGGITWTNVWRRDSGDDSGPRTATVDISAIAANQANVMVRFHYYNANFDWWWEIDDVLIGPPACSPPPAGGLVVGNVYDDNTGTALTGATVFNDRGYSFTAVSTVDPNVDDAFYTLFSPPGAHVFTARQSGGYAAGSAFINVPDGGTVGQDFYLRAGMPSSTPPALDVTLDMGMSTTIPITLTNQGRVAVDWQLLELDKGFGPLGPFHQPTFGVKPFKQGYPTAQGLGIPDPPSAPPLAAGNVLQSWTPTGVGSNAWGIAYDGWNSTVWIGDGWGTTDNAVEHRSDGTPTGRAWPYNWPTLGLNGPADFTFNQKTGMLWVLNVNTVDNCIHEIDPAAGATGNVICPGGGTGFATSQRGLAYDPATDTYLAGGWNDLMVYRFDSAGTILQQVNTGLAIAGLAYNADTQHLFVMVNGNPNPVYVLDAANNFTITGQFNVSAGFGPYGGAGLEIDCDGNLWAVDQNTNTVYQFESGETTSMCAQDVPWLSENPITGTLGAATYTYRPIRNAPGRPTIPPVTTPSEVPLTISSPATKPERTPTTPAPKHPDVVLWDQPLSTVSQNGYIDQDFPDLPAYSSFLADDFVNTEAWDITKIFIPGNGWNGFTTLTNALSLVWAIYADNGGVPAGAPSGGGDPPVWTIALPPDDPQVELSAGTGGWMSNVMLNLARPVGLPAGHWWLVFYPVMERSVGGQYGRQPADTTNGYTGQFINPGGGWGLGTAWLAWTVLGPSQQDIAFRLEGSVAEPAVQVVDVTFDASVPEITQPGRYYAQLKVRHNTPYLLANIPVTMTVNAPATWGKLAGTVRGLGYCDAHPAPLDGASVFIQASDGATWTLTTTPTGTYSIWLDEAHSPLTVTATYADHQTGQVTGVMITGQQTTTVDLDLRWLRPCMGLSPNSFEVWVVTGTLVYTHPTGLDITNNGAASLDFELQELGAGSGGPPTILYDNGPLVTHPGACGGMDASRLQTSLGMGTLGFGHQVVYGNRIADDFTISDPGGWQLQRITFFAYQTGAPSDPSPITGVYYQIWDGPPSDPASNVIFGDLTTNRLVTSTFSNIQRDSETTTCPGNRYIFADVAEAGVTLPPGTYWLDWTTDGSSSYSGPWAPPITILGQTTTGNALQYTGSWAPALDSGTGTQQGFPFLIEGSVTGDVPWLWEVPVTGTVPADSMENVGIYFTAMSGTVPMALGTYTATLSVENNDPTLGPQDLPVTMHIIENYITPTASFTATTPVCLGEPMIFTNTTSGGVPPASSYLWDFGDGYTSTVEHPTHLYGMSGNYTVTLEACNSAGQCDTHSEVVEVLPSPTAGFTYTVNQLTVTFTNTSAGATGYLWAFGDGFTSTLMHPVHTYAAEGTYTVTLWADNGMCVDAFSAQVTVGLAPVAGFVSNSPVCQGTAMVFTNTTTGTLPRSYLWDFGDGYTSTLEHPTHLYGAAGSYTVTLTATNAFGSDQRSAVVEVLPLPTAGFTYTVNQLTVTFTNTSAGATGYLWDFGDGFTSTLVHPVHTYAAEGTYTVTLWADNGTCTDAFSAQVTVGLAPVAGFVSNSPVCQGTAMVFTNTTTGTPPRSYLWDFGDGYTSTLEHPTHLYGAAGLYTVTLTATNAFGSDQRSAIVEVLPLPTAGFTYMVNQLTVTFTNTSANATGYLWDFGDGLTSTLTHPVHTYAAEGTYTVTLWADNGTCVDAFSAQVTVGLAPVAGFVSNSPVCQGTAMVFTNTTTGTLPRSYLWDFGDGYTSTLEHPTHLYGAAGLYTVTLTATNAFGSDQHSAIVEVLPLPTAGFTYMVNQLTVTFTNTSANATGYLWAFGDGFTSTLTHPTHVYAVPGPYTVTLTATSGCGSDTAVAVVLTYLYSVTVELPLAAQSGNPGTAVAYTLRITNTGTVTDTFDLSASGNAWTTDLPASVGPLAAGTGADVQVVVHIPANAPGGASDAVTVTATSRGDPSRANSLVLTTTANNVYGVVLEPPAATRVGAPGTSVTHTLRLTNTGNTTDTFTLTKSTSAWTTTLPASVGPLAAGAGADVQVVVQIPAGAPGGASDVVTVIATSQGDPTKSDASVLTTRVPGAYDVLLEPETAAQSGDPGTAVTYTLRLTNIGAFSDTFDLSASGNAWTTDLPASVGPLAAGAGADVQVVVHIPANAPGGASDTVTVTATSQGDPTRADSSVLTTTANNVYGVVLEPPAATQVGAPGTAVTYTLRLTNTGNTTDTFTLTKSTSAWTTTLPASVGPLAAGAGADVQVVVQIPAGAPGGAGDVVTVTATSQGDPTKSDASVLTTRVPGAYDVLLEPETAAQSGDPGTAVTYTLRLTNTGTVADAFDLSASGNAWTTDLPASVGPLAAGTGADVQVVVHIPANAPGGASDAVTVTATSRGDPTRADSSVLTTTANNVYGVVLEPPAATRVGAPGTSVTHTLRLTNTGNTTDTFTLTKSTSAWTTTILPTSVLLGAGKGADVRVVVNIPANAADNSSDVVTITATSQGNAAKSDASVLTTRAKTYRLYLPLVLRNHFINPYEENDSRVQAYGPLSQGVEYRAYPDDSEDWYYFDLPGVANVTVEVTNFTGGGGRLLVYRGSETNPIGDWWQGGSTMRVELSNASAGRYYIRIVTGSGFNTTTLYTLVVRW